ncbi:MAG: hypothetical protein H0T47_11775 [Planctomycetaceae bacterium]|nr:hypothetical protein [Planctomycetaceae bacterium]
MTEFELALEFLQTYVQTAASPAQAGEPLRDRNEFFAFCDDRGVEATTERVELVRDLASVINACVRRGEHESDAEVEDPDARLITSDCLTHGLECYGWRMAFLTKRVGD